jgi:hypothetical protein
MVPAIINQNGVKATMAGANAIIKSMGDKQYKEYLNAHVLEQSSHLSIRDFFFEKFEAVDDRPSAYNRIVENIEKKTVTGIMSTSDRMATTLNYLSALAKQGVDFTSLETMVKTITADRVAQADLNTILLQNVSSAAFTAPVLRPKEDGSAAIAQKILWGFKSFNLNAMINMWLSAPEIFSNKEARNIFTSHLISNVTFELGARGVKYGLYYYAFNTAMQVGAAILGVEPPEPPEDKSEKSALEYAGEFALTTFINSMFGGLPTAADAMAKWAYNWAYTMVTGKEQDWVFAAKDFQELAPKLLGIYSGMAAPLIDGATLLYDIRLGKDVTEARTNRIGLKVLSDIVAFMSFIPFRGDISKLIGTQASVRGQIARGNKKASTKTRRKISRKIKR